MSNVNNDLEVEAYFKDNKGKWHRDLFGTWYMKNSGYESLFLNQIRDENLKSIVERCINDFPNEKSKSFEAVEGMNVTVFPESKAVSRKSEVDINNEELFDTEVPVEERVSRAQKTSSSSGSSSSDGERKKSPIYVDEDFVKFTDYQEQKKNNKWLCLNPKAQPNTFVLKIGNEPATLWVMIARMEWNY